MNFAKPLGFLEIGLFVCFGIAYLLYITRLVWVARQTGSQTPAFVFKLLTRTAYFSLLILALLGPSFGEVKKEVKAIGKDIFFLVDLSSSMDAVDIKPSRLEKVKFELKNLINTFSSDRLGLIIFSSGAFMQCPLTYDGAAMRLFTETLSSDLISGGGTDFAPALALAVEKLAVDDEVGKNQSKIVILISDGEDFGDESTAMANKLKDAGISFFALGVGTETGSKIPMGGGRFKRNNVGSDVLSTLNSGSMQKMAAATGGKYFEVSDKRNDMTRLVSAIDLIEGDLRASRKVDAAANKYYYFLAAALALMALDLLVTVRTVRV